jgi:RHS repeat-associated protein
VGTLYYLFTDHLGSPNLITDASGNTVQELSFDAWGKRRDPATWLPFIPGSNTSGTDIGFTGHRHLDIFGLVNMDGRIYDPVIGRFISPDPVLQFPGYTQGLNPYSYCLNNPLRFTDPSGYSIDFFDALQGIMIGVASMINPAAGIMWAATCAAANGMYAIAKGSGTNLFFDHILPATIFATMTMGSSKAIGDIFGKTSGFWKELGRASAHGVSNGTIRLVQGGKFEHGFLAGFISSGVSSMHLSDNLLINTAVAATVGGTTEAIGGGKFLNGAVTGAYVFLMNHAAHPELAGSKHSKGKDAYNEARSRTNNQSNGYKETPFFKVKDIESGEVYFYVMAESEYEANTISCNYKLWEVEGKFYLDKEGTQEVFLQYHTSHADDCFFATGSEFDYKTSTKFGGMEVYHLNSIGNCGYLYQFSTDKSLNYNGKKVYINKLFESN